MMIYCFGVNHVPLSVNSLSHVKLSEEEVEQLQGTDSLVAREESH
jgi:hypothetical protein